MLLTYQALEDPDSAGQVFSAYSVILDTFIQPFSLSILISLIVLLLLLFFLYQNRLLLGRVEILSQHTRF